MSYRLLKMWRVVLSSGSVTSVQTVVGQLPVLALALCAQTPHKLTKTDIDRWMTELSNWGRWGKDDQIGTLNHIRPDDIVRAASLIRRGKVFALGIPLSRWFLITTGFGVRGKPRNSATPLRSTLRSTAAMRSMRQC